MSFLAEALPWRLLHNDQLPPNLGHAQLLLRDGPHHFPNNNTHNVQYVPSSTTPPRWEEHGSGVGHG